MAIGLIFNESTVALTEESTEGTYTAPTGATEYVEVLSDGVELNKTRELLERDLLASTVETEAARVGIADVTGTIPVEYKASSTEGTEPQSLDLLLKSLLGGKRQLSSVITSDVGHTDTQINLADGDAANFEVGDIILVKEAGAYEMRPVTAVDTGTGTNSITFPFALDNGAPSDGVDIGKFTTYYHDTTNAPTLSAEHNLGSQGIQQEAAGLRAASMSLENWTTGQLPTASFSVQGLSLNRKDEDASFSPDFTADGQPPVALQACAWVGGNKLSYTEFTLNIENTVNYIQDACDEDGRIGSRITQQTITANINPYMDDTDLTQTWDKFNDNDDVSFFIYAFNPTSTDGEFGEAVAVWLPQCRIIEDPAGNNEGIINEQLSIRAHRDTGNDSVFLGFS